MQIKNIKMNEENNNLVSPFQWVLHILDQSEDKTDL